MEATEIILWSLKVLRYLLILIGIGGNLALFKKYLTQKNLGVLFNCLILWIAVFDACYLIFLATKEGIQIALPLTKDKMDKETRNGLKDTWYAMLYLHKICFSASVLSTIILATERYLVFQKRKTIKCNFKWILISIGNYSKRLIFVQKLKFHKTFLF